MAISGFDFLDGVADTMTFCASGRLDLAHGPGAVSELCDGRGWYVLYAIACDDWFLAMSLRIQLG